jgi:hypothetical protein
LLLENILWYDIYLRFPIIRLIIPGYRAGDMPGSIGLKTIGRLRPPNYFHNPDLRIIQMVSNP